MTAGRVQVTFDCTDPVSLGRFWAAALRYPQPDIARWHDSLRSIGHGEEDLDDWCRIDDPNGIGPPLFFQRVPEPKVVKNRVHLDIAAAADGPGDRRGQIDAEAKRLIELGASKLRSVTDEAGYFVVMQDVEGNEFCVD